MRKPVIIGEAGAVLNKRNRSALQLAFETITSVLEDAGVIAKRKTSEDDDDDDEAEDDDDTKKTKTAAKAADTKEAVSNRRAIEAGGFSNSDLAALLQNALNDTRPESRDGEYVAPYRIVDIFDDYFVYAVGWSSETYRVDFSVTDDGTVTLSPPLYVNRKVTYIAPAVSDLTASEAGAYDIREDFVRLAEGAIGSDGRTLIKLIAPGLGSSGVYTPDVLMRDGARAFPRGTKMYIDHDTAEEERSKPEGTLTRFAAVLEEDAKYIPDHKAGAGLYARATVFETYRDDLNQMADYIGTSIRADGQAKIGDYNGARVPIITAIKASNGINNRVDFVTAPGAGGRILSLFESARKREPLTDDTREDLEMTDDQIKKIVQDGIAAGIREAVTPIQTEIARLREADTLRSADKFARQTLDGPKYSTLPATTRDRIAGAVALTAPLTESGAIDAVKFAEAIEAAAQAEAAYLSSATGRTVAIGLGESRAPDATGEHATKLAETDEADMIALFQSWGHSEASAKIAARGRVA